MPANAVIQADSIPCKGARAGWRDRIAYVESRTRGTRSAALPGADEQLFHLFRFDCGHRERVERRSFRAEALQRYPNVTPPQLRTHVLGRIHHGADHHQDDAVVLCGCIAADLAGGLGALDEFRGQRVELRPLLPRAFGRLWGAEKNLLEPAVVGPELERAFVSGDDGVPRVRVVQPLLVDASPLVELLLEERVDEHLLVWEAPVDGADADARVVCDGVQGDAEAALGKQLARRLEDPLAVPLSVLAKRLFRGAHDAILPVSGTSESKWIT